MQLATTIIFFYCTSIVFADFRRNLQSSLNVWKTKVGNNLCNLLPQQNCKTIFNSPTTTCVEKILFPSRAADIARREAQLTQINEQLNHLTEMMRLLNVSVLDDASLIEEEDKNLPL